MEVNNNNNNKSSIVEKHIDNLPDGGWFDDVAKKNTNSSPDWDALKNTNISNATWLNGILSFLQKTSPASPNYESDELERVGLMTPLAMVYVITYLGLIIYFTYIGALDDSNRRFLSLEYVNNLDVECREIPIPVYGLFGMDKSGRWSSESLYLANESVYELNFAGSQLTTDKFQKVMINFTNSLTALGQRGSRRDMAWNLIALSSWEVREEESNMKFSMSTDATIVYDQAVYTAAIMTKKLGVCQETLQTYGDFSSPYFRIHIPVNYTKDIYYNDTYVVGTGEERKSLPLPCEDYIPRSMVPSYTQWTIRDGWVTLQFDLRSIITAQSINMGILDFSYMQITQSTFPGLLKLPKGAFYVDPAYEGMRPIYCLDQKVKGAKGPGTSVCYYVDGGYAAGQIVYYPWSVSINYNEFAGTEACTCPDYEFNEACNIMDVVFIMYFDKDSDDNTIELGENIANIMNEDKDNGDITITKMMYPLITSATAAYFDPFSNYSSLVKDLFDPFCSSPTCGAVVLESSVYDFFQPVNKQNLQLVSLTDITYSTEPSENNGNTSTGHQSMCTDYLYIKEALAAVSNKVPQPLVNAYYECNSKFYYALKNSVGNGAGSAGLACAILLPIVTYIIAFIYNRINASKRVYFANEKKGIKSLLEKREKHALNRIVEGIVDELLIVRNEVVDYRVILTKLLASVKGIPSTEYRQIVELLKRQIVPDDALQQELLAFKRYYLYERKETILESEKVRMTGRQVVFRESHQDAVDKANSSLKQIQGKRKLIKKKESPADIEKDSTMEPSISSTDQSHRSMNRDALSTVTLGILSWDTFSPTEKEMAESKFKPSNTEV